MAHRDDLSQQHPQSLDWLLFAGSTNSSDILAPHPDAFESELDSLALQNLESELAALPNISVESLEQPNFGFFNQYRESAPSAYSGFGGGGPASTITASTESLSAYGSAYDSTYDYKQPPATSLSSLFPDLDFSAIEIGSNHNLDFDLMLGSTSSPQLDALAADSVLVAPESAAVTSLLARRNSSNYGGAGSVRGTGARSRNGSAYEVSSSGVSTGYHPYSSATTASSASARARNVPMNPNSAHAAVIGSSGITASVNTSSQSLTTPSAPSSTSPTSDADPRKKYQCPTCPRAFARAFNLKTHMATHDPNRIKNFHCPHTNCGRSFSRKHDLGRHMMSIHQDSSMVTSTGSTHESSSNMAPAASPPPESSSNINGTSVNGKASSTKADSPIGMGNATSKGATRVWCDSCGRGWLAGSRDACGCVASPERVH